MLVIWLILALAVITLLISYICFRMAFYVPDRDPAQLDTAELPDEEIYREFRPLIGQWIREMRAMPHEEFSITSFDGLKLYAKYFEYAPGAPLEIMFHGYRGSAERDLAGGVQRAFKVGRSVLLVDQRCSGKSDGNVISFGINEHRDCLAWAQFAREHFGPEVKIILTGISMGASTVMMVSDKDLPDNVVGILADCGFTSAKDIIKVVIRGMHLPPALAYPFVKLGAKIFGHFDLEEDSSLGSVRNSKLPIIFYHGEADDFVPCYMSRENYEACSSRKALVTVPGAGHGLSYPKDQQGYLDSLYAFFGPELSHPSVRR